MCVTAVCWHRLAYPCPNLGTLVSLAETGAWLEDKLGKESRKSPGSQGVPFTLQFYQEGGQSQIKEATNQRRPALESTESDAPHSSRHCPDDSVFLRGPMEADPGNLGILVNGFVPRNTGPRVDGEIPRRGRAQREKANRPWEGAGERRPRH